MFLVTLNIAFLLTSFIVFKKFIGCECQYLDLVFKNLKGWANMKTVARRIASTFCFCNGAARLVIGALLTSTLGRVQLLF
jgi:hypothetical protein